MNAAESALYLCFGRLLRQARHDKGISQADLALKAGMSRSAVANIEAGLQTVALHQLVLIASGLGVQIGDLVVGAGSLTTAEKVVKEQRAEIAALQGRISAARAALGPGGDT